MNVLFTIEEMRSSVATETRQQEGESEKQVLDQRKVEFIVAIQHAY